MCGVDASQLPASASSNTAGEVEVWLTWMVQDRESTYWASSSSDDAVKGQGIGDTKGHPSRASGDLGIDGSLTN